MTVLLSQMTDQDVGEHAACVKDLLEIARITKLLGEEGHLDLKDAHDMAKQASQLGMIIWKGAWEDIPTERKDSHKIDRGTRVVVD